MMCEAQRLTPIDSMESCCRCGERRLYQAIYRCTATRNLRRLFYHTHKRRVSNHCYLSQGRALKQAWAANFGRVKNNPMKQSRVISEYEKLCGVNGAGRPSKLGQIDRISQEDIAKQLGVMVDTLVVY